MFKRLRRALYPARSVETLPSVAAYAKWAATYPPAAHNALMRAEESAMRALMPPLTDRIVLDLACGTGRYGVIAREAGARAVIALDNSPHMLAANPLTWRALATTAAIPLAAESVDAILCGLALGHLPQIAPSLREIARVLRIGGAALISDVHPALFTDAARAQRTFVAADGTTYAVEHYPHTIDTFKRIGADVGLRLDAIQTPHAPEAPTRAPVAVVYRFIRTGLPDA